MSTDLRTTPMFRPWPHTVLSPELCDAFERLAAEHLLALEAPDPQFAARRRARFFAPEVEDGRDGS